MPDAGLVAADAGADVVQLAGLRLARHLGVADHRTRHADHVGLAGCDHLLGVLRLVDAAGDEHRRLDPGFHRCRERRHIGVGDRHRRRDMHRAAEPRRRAGDHVDVVQRVAERDDRLQALGFLQAFGILLVAADSEADDGRVIDMRAHRGDHFAQEAQAVLERSAIFVVALVDARIEELRRQIAMARHDLEPIQPGAAQPPRGLAIAVDHIRDHRLAHRPRHHMEALVRHRGGRVGDRRAAVLAFHDLAPRVEQLPEDLAAVLVHRLGQPPIARHARLRRHQHVRGVFRGLVDAGGLHDDEPGAALGARLVIGDQRIVRHAAGDQRGVVAGRENAVLDLQSADADGREQMREGSRCHDRLTPARASAASRPDAGRRTPWPCRPRI